MEDNLSVSTIGGGGDMTIPSPGRSPKQPLPGIGLHDPLHGRQACPPQSLNDSSECDFIREQVTGLLRG